ncbi:MAG: integrase arm-type DNA-binding domain-containing protein [Albidovulum sp.]|nr:integrase arm-type DNA-binding domain-containing protein [Albidovulum sp.]
MGTQLGKRGYPGGRLTDALVHTATGPGKLYDGVHGLFLRIDPSGARRWAQRIVVRGRTREFGLGGYPLVTLAQAREKALANRRVARQGGDPAESPWQARPPPAAPAARSAAPTFDEAAVRFIALQTPGWKNGGKSAFQWQYSLDQYASPALGSKRIDEIEPAHVAAAVLPIWGTKRETATRVKQRIGAVMEWAIASGYRADNPARSIAALLPNSPQARSRHRAIPHAEVGDAVRAVLASGAWPGTRIAFAFLVLTACRSGEVRGAEVRELDRSGEIWTIPGRRTKSGRQHRVPLSSGARHLLDASPLDCSSGLLFPSPRGKELSDATMSKLLRSLGIDAVPHGFRSSFRDWASEVEQAEREVAEIALAHVPYGGAEAAYARSDLLERRRALMQSWCDYLELDRPTPG